MPVFQEEEHRPSLVDTCFWFCLERAWEEKESANTDCTDVSGLGLFLKFLFLKAMTLGFNPTLNTAA